MAERKPLSKKIRYDDARTALNKIGGICYNRKNNITWKRRD
jgi:hypothetical protein